MSDPRRSDDVQVVLSMHPARVQEFSMWLRNNSNVGSAAHNYGLQIEAQGHGARLVVIDPEDREQVERLRVALVEAGAFRPVLNLVGEAHAILRREQVTTALHAFANPTPPIFEPSGLGAVVLDSQGRIWVRYLRPGTSAPWVWSEAPSDIESRSVWSAIPAVEVLSEGVAP